MLKNIIFAIVQTLLFCYTLIRINFGGICSMKLFDKTYSVSIFLEKNTEEAVLLAARDLQSDLRKISGKENGFDIKSGTSPFAINVITSGDGTPESYTVTVTSDSVEIVGSDVLGTVYGIYAFSGKCLGVIPIHKFVDVFPASREEMEIANTELTSPERKVRFRGWFLNDEDLLTEWKISGGKRNIDYPFYGDVMDPSVLDMVLEAALRMEINLVIPSSFVDIVNPAEEELIKTAVRRGMYVSQHHVEPVGVSYFAADNYMKAKGYETETVSFIQNRERMEEIWRHYIERWAKYGKNVIWQLGLRGKADQAVWKSDPNVPTDESARGAIITDAIATQHRIISETLGHSDFVSTSTLWLEGAALYGGGYISLPKGTIVIFSDIGYNQMLGNDFYTTARKPEDKYGIYYHVGYWVQGPHLAEGTDLRKMEFSYREAAKMNSLDYAILNVSNLRPLHFSAWLSSKLLLDPMNSSVKELAEDQLLWFFGDDAPAVSPILWDYYDTIADRGKGEIIYNCKRSGFDYRDFGELPYPERPLTDGTIRYAIGKSLHKKDTDYTESTEDFRKTLEENLPKWEALAKRAEGIQLRDENKLYFEQFLKFEIFYMMQMTRAAIACRALMDTSQINELDSARECALAAFDSIVEARKILEIGKWENWHRGEKKIGIIKWIADVEKAYKKRKAELE